VSESVHGAGAVCDPDTFQILYIPLGRIHGRSHGYKWSLLKVREEKHKGKHGSWKPRASVSALQVLLKPTITYGKGRTR
jgi:hypothetical protein